MLSILVGLGSIAGLFCLWAYHRAERTAEEINQAFCPIRHKVGQITLRHYEGFDCEKALEIAETAQWVWWEWVVPEPEFREHIKKLNPTKGFGLLVIFDRSRNYGGQLRNRVTVNLVKRPAKDAEYKRALLSTLAEELHHLAEWRVYGDEPVVLTGERDVVDHKTLIRYYGVNPREHRGLRFAVAHVEWRVELFEEVEEYRALHNIV